MYLFVQVYDSDFHEMVINVIHHVCAANALLFVLE